MKNYLAFLLALSINFVVCRDFYVGMFQKNDILVAQDRLYKERVPYRVQYAKYGRHFKCAITYFRVVDRLGYGPGPKVVITRGGLRKKYIVLRLQSMYNQPISVNIYVGCANRMRSTTRPRTRKPIRDGTTEGGSSNATDDGSNSTDASNNATIKDGDTQNGTDATNDKDGQKEPPKTEDGKEPPKTEDGKEPPKSEDGKEPPKSEDGKEPPKSEDGKET